MSELASTPGIVALAALALAAVGVVAALVLAVKLSRLRRAQRTVLGDGSRDLVGHAAGLEAGFEDLRGAVEQSSAALRERLLEAERRLDQAIAYRALVRYDAYNEMSGRQSSSIALLDASRSGIVLSSIHHRDQARLYVKRISAGQPELELSPEEAEAVELAVNAGREAPVPPAG